LTEARTKPLRVTLLGNGNYANLGCEAIVRGTVRLLREEFPGAITIDSAYFCSESCRDELLESDPGITHHRPRFWKRYSREHLELLLARLRGRQLVGPKGIEIMCRPFEKPMQDADVILMAGGDNYTLDYSPPDQFFYLNALAERMGKPYALWGASIGPFRSDPAYERKAAEQLRRVPLIAARETETVKYLAGIGVEENVRLVADPSYFLDPEPVELPEDVERLLAEGCIGLNLSPFLARFHPTAEAWEDVAAAVVSRIVEVCGLPVLLVPHVRSNRYERKFDDDHVFLSRIRERLPRGCGPVALVGRDLSAGATKWVIGRTRVFAGARTHSTLASLSSGVPTLILGYSMKARGIALDQFGDETWLLEGADVLPEPTAGAMRRLIEAEGSVRSLLRERVPAMRERARQSVRYVRDLVETGKLRS